MENNNDTIKLKELAKSFEIQIKKTVADKFRINSENLSLLLGDEKGVYLSEEEVNTLCCFVIDEKNGFLYLVTAKIADDGQSLTEFKSDVIS